MKDRAGKVVRTLDAARNGAALKTSWHDRTEAGRWAVDGAYTRQPSAAPEDGSGARPVADRNVQPHRRDARFPRYLNGGSGDLMTLSSSGYLTTHYGNGTVVFGGKASGSGRPAGTVAVPFGDLGEDRCTDLIARQSSTGDIYLYADNGAGGFKARTKIRTAWTAYTHLIGAGTRTATATATFSRAIRTARSTAMTTWRTGSSRAGAWSWPARRSGRCRAMAARSMAPASAGAAVGVLSVHEARCLVARWDRRGSRRGLCGRRRGGRPAPFATGHRHALIVQGRPIPASASVVRIVPSAGRLYRSTLTVASRPDLRCGGSELSHRMVTAEAI
ncbi:hypothetical protein DKG71_35295 [Streptomyces sp. NEAU-S7GS2]|nr:hypothetical protein DKG71_35295 [Streptomyces sp. NEAU-S7GS2]